MEAKNDKLQFVKVELDEVTEIMINNVKNIQNNMDSAAALEEKTEQLSKDSRGFKDGSTRLKRRMWCQHMKLKLIVALVVAILLLFIIIAVYTSFR